MLPYVLAGESSRRQSEGPAGRGRNPDPVLLSWPLSPHRASLELVQTGGFRVLEGKTGDSKSRSWGKL